jgi:hypothetical protein
MVCGMWHLHNFKQLFQLDHELPILLLQVVAEVIFARVNGSSTYLQKIKEKNIENKTENPSSPYPRALY